MQDEVANNLRYVIKIGAIFDFDPCRPYNFERSVSLTVFGDGTGGFLSRTRHIIPETLQ